MILFNLVSGLTEANAIHNDRIYLETIIQSFVVYFNEYGIPYDTNIIEAMIALGILVQLSSWVLTPSKTIIKVAKEGNLLKFF